MPSYGVKMRAYQPPEARMPPGIALVWAMVDLPLALLLRTQQVTVDTCREWKRVCEGGEETMMTHWAADMHDSSRTGCNQPVGYVLAELEQDVTPRASAVDCRGCREFLDAAETHANQQVYGETERAERREEETL